MPNGNAATSAAQGAATGATFGPWGALIGAGAGLIGTAIGGTASRRRRRRAKSRQQQAFQAMRAAQAGAYREAGQVYSPFREAQQRQLSALERTVTDPQAAVEARQQALERAAQRRLPGLRAGQVARGMFTSGPGLAQEAEFQKGLEASIFETQEQARERYMDRLLQTLAGPAEQGRMFEAQAPMVQAGITGQAAQARVAPYTVPGAAEEIGAGMTGLGTRMFESWMLNRMLSGRGGGGGRTPAQPEPSRYDRTGMYLWPK